MGATRTNRALTRGLPTVTVLSMTAAATLSMAGTASAATSSGHSSDAFKAQIQAWFAAHPGAVKRYESHKVSTQGVTADFGFGKAAIPVEAMPDTFPSTLNPVFDQLQLQATLTGPTPGGPIPCFLMADSPATPITTSDPDDCIIPTIPEGDSYTVAPGEGGSVPAGFLMPAAVTGSMTDDVAAGCTFAPPVGGPALAASTDGASTEGQSQPTIPYCVGPTMQVPGIWNPITLTVTNSITGKPVEGAKYTLFGPSDQTAPETLLRAAAGHAVKASAVPTPLGTATTDAAGHLRFPGVFLGGDYTVSESKGPKGYREETHSHSFTTPVVTTLAQAGKTFNKSVTLTPQAPTLHDDASGGAFGAKQVIHVLDNDSTPVGALTVTSVTKPAHGTLTRKADGTLVYRPDTGFTGTDHFSYTARNTLGATSTAAVTVVVHPAVEAEGDVLPFTGQRTGTLLDAGLISLAIGALLTAAGMLRRRRTS
jgi:hypothetical protein